MVGKSKVGKLAVAIAEISRSKGKWKNHKLGITKEVRIGSSITITHTCADCGQTFEGQSLSGYLWDASAEAYQKFNTTNCPGRRES